MFLFLLVIFFIKVFIIYIKVGLLGLSSDTQYEGLCLMRIQLIREYRGSVIRIVFNESSIY